MALITCKECKEQVSNKATTCPKCGAPVPKGSAWGVLALGFVIWLAWFTSSRDPVKAPEHRPETSPAEATATPTPEPQGELPNISPTKLVAIQMPVMACYKADDFAEFVRFAIAKDEDAMTQLVVQLRCYPLAPGDKVYLTDVSLFKGLAQIRRKGMTEKAWTSIEAVRLPPPPKP